MSFAEEVAQANSERGKEAAPEIMDATISEFNAEPVVATPGDAPVLPVGEAQKSDEPKKTRIRIGMKEFDNTEAALEYAQALEIQQAEAEGYKKAHEEIKAKDLPPVKDEDEELSELMFENPREYQKRIIAKAQAIADEKAKQVAHASQLQAEKQNWWSSFWQANPDLQESTDIVEFVLQKHWSELGYIDRNEAAQKLADKTRHALRGKRDATLPSEVLPSGHAVVAPTSSTATPKVEAKQDTPIDFVSQVNNIRKRMKR